MRPPGLVRGDRETPFSALSAHSALCARDEEALPIAWPPRRSTRPGTPRAQTRSPSLEHQHQRVLDHATERLEEHRAVCTVDYAVVAAHRHAEALPRPQLAVDDDRLLIDRADRQDRRLRRIDDGRELVDPELAEIRD